MTRCSPPARRRALRAIRGWAVVLGLSAPYATSATLAAAPDPHDAMLATLQRLDQRVADVGYRLANAAAAAGSCAHQRRLSGITLHSAEQYQAEWRAAAERRYGMGGDIGVEAVAANSPAAAAGLRSGDRLLAIDAVPAPAAGRSRGASFARTAAALGQLDAAAARGATDLRILRDGGARDVAFTAQPGCDIAFQLRTDPGYSASTGEGWVSISGQFVAFAADDAELAFILGHELAHAIAGDDAADEAAGATGLARMLGKDHKRVLADEIRADRLGLALAACAGYDPAAGARLWRRYARQHPLSGLLSDGTHQGNGARTGTLDRQVADIARLRAAAAPVCPAPAGFSAQFSG